MATVPKITLYLDTVSPFAYIAFHVLQVSTQRHESYQGQQRAKRCYQNNPVFRECSITYIPIFLGGLMKQCGNTAPINITSKTSKTSSCTRKNIGAIHILVILINHNR